MKRIIITGVIICLLIICLASCNDAEVNDTGITLTEDFVRTELAKYDYSDITMEGAADDISSITLTIKGIYADGLVNKQYTREALTQCYENSGKMNLRQLAVSRAFNGVLGVCGLFDNSDKRYSSSSEFIEEFLPVVCDNQIKTYENWTVSATISRESNSITIKAIKN